MVRPKRALPRRTSTVGLPRVRSVRRVSGIWPQLFESGFARIPAPVGKQVCNRLYRALDAYVEVARRRPDNSPVHEEARRWFERRPDWKFYRGAFAPYFKGANADTHGTDRKQTFQLSEMYYRFLSEQRAELFDGDEFRNLVDGAM
ncbi:MAG: hypothetical protein AAB403_00095, partial [Planctomycetota bacterium]